VATPGNATESTSHQATTWVSLPSSASRDSRLSTMMQVIKMYAEDTRTSIPTADKRAYEATSETPVPSTYTNDHFYGVADKYGGTEPTGPR